LQIFLLRLSIFLFVMPRRDVSRFARRSHNNRFIGVDVTYILADAAQDTITMRIKIPIARRSRCFLCSADFEGTCVPGRDTWPSCRA
jgi:hypothetical protein